MLTLPHWMCAACGWPGINASPWDAGQHDEEHCPCCGLWYGPWDYDAEGPEHYTDWRLRWLQKGGAWSATWVSQPKDWDREAQVARIEADAAGVAAWFEYCVKGIMPVRDMETADGLAVAIFGADEVSTKLVAAQVLEAASRAKNIDRLRVRLVGSDSRLSDLEHGLLDQLPGWAIDRLHLQAPLPCDGDSGTDGSAWAEAYVALAPQVAGFYKDLGVDLGFDLPTLGQLEDLYDHRFVWDASESPFPHRLGGLSGAAAYLGEAIRRASGGRWVGPSSPLVVDYGLALELPDGSRIWPRQRLAKRLGKSDGTGAQRRDVASAAGPDAGPRDFTAALEDAAVRLIAPYMHEGRKLLSAHALAAGLGLSIEGRVGVLELRRVVGL